MNHSTEDVKMNPRRGLGLLWALVTVTIIGAVAWFAYHAGVETTVITSGHDPGAAYPAYYHYGAGFGFGIFPLFFFILLIVLLFRGRRWHRPWGYGGWGYGPGWGHGPGYGPGYGPGQPGGTQGPGPDVPPGMEERLHAWHEKAHGQPTAGPDPQG
ncbi:MAG: hypothetical protein QOK05_547 [Chloroflexota bacterium]|jgi:hypothetical protein|nr:hypothetical protein [Chloroflexota bacterium]